MTTHVIAWVPSSATAFPSGYVSGYENFLLDLQSSLGQPGNISSVAAQYVDASGSALSSLTVDPYITDTQPYPTSGCSVISGASACLTETQVQDEIRRLISSDTTGTLSVNLNQSYMVLLPPNVDTCFDGGGCRSDSFCGYHDLLTDGSANTTFSLLPYTAESFDPPGACAYSQYPTGSSSELMTLDSIGAHELMESVTDPAVGTPGIGIGYADANEWEIADECAWDYGTPSTDGGGGSYNQTINGHEYLIQLMWSNQSNACVAGDPAPATATVTAGANAVTNSPTPLSASLAGASATGYVWSYMDPNGNVAQDVSNSASPQLMLSTPGTYTVWVQITDASGGTVTGVSTVSVTAAPTAAFNYTYETAVPATGSPINFTSSSSAPSGYGITATSWNFGDGGSASGASVSHTYAAPGTYTVTLTVTESNGTTTQKSVAITVDGQPHADFTWSAKPIAGTSVSFSSSTASAGSGSITAYSWNFGDGGTSTAQNPTYTYSAGGNFTVTLTVTQSDGLTASIQHTVTVAAAPPPTPSRFALNQGLVPPGKATRITTLLKRRQATSVVSANVAGRIAITWYATVKRHKLVVARGSANVQAGVASHVVVRLTAAGRSLLRRSRRLRVTITGAYTAGGTTVTSKKTITLRR